MAEFTLTIQDADVTRVTSALCGTFNLSYYHNGVDPNTTPWTADVAKAVLIDMLQTIVIQVETQQAIAGATAGITPPQMQ